MTIVIPPTETHSNEYEPRRRFTTVLGADDPRFDEWIDVRRAFVIEKGWRNESHEERDIYDDDAITAQLVTFGENNEILFGMRLTPISKIANSLSWDMVKDSSIHSQAAEEAEKLHEQLWDLTRLVPGPHIAPETRPEVIIELFYEGLRYCQEQGDPDPVWFFALDKGLNAWLRRERIDVTQLGSAKIGTDEVETLFGAVRPAQIAKNRFSPLALFDRLNQESPYVN